MKKICIAISVLYNCTHEYGYALEIQACVKRMIITLASKSL